MKQTAAKAIFTCLSISILMGSVGDALSQNATKPATGRETKEARAVGSMQIRERVDPEPANNTSEIQRLQAQISRLDAVLGDLILSLTSRGYLASPSAQAPQPNYSQVATATSRNSPTNADSAGGTPTRKAEIPLDQRQQTGAGDREANRHSTAESTRPVARSTATSPQGSPAVSTASSASQKNLEQMPSSASNQRDSEGYEARLAKAISVEGPESRCGKNSNGAVTTIGPARIEVKHLRPASDACARARLVLEQFGRENAAANFAFTFGQFLILGTYTELHSGSLYTPPNLTALMESSRYPEGVDTTSFKSNHQTDPIPHAYSQMVGSGNGTLFQKADQEKMIQGWLVIPVNGKRGDMPFGGLVQIVVRAPATAFSNVDKVLSPLISSIRSADETTAFLQREDFLKFSLERDVPTFVDGREWQLIRGVPKEKESRLR